MYEAAANEFRPRGEIAMKQQDMADLQVAEPKLLDQVSITIRLKGMSYQTEKTYADWIR